MLLSAVAFTTGNYVAGRPCHIHLTGMSHCPCTTALRHRATSGFFWLQISFEFLENLFQGFKLKSFFFFFRTFYWFRSWRSMIAHDAPSWDSRATSSCTLWCLKSGSALSLSGPQMETITTTINLQNNSCNK